MIATQHNCATAPTTREATDACPCVVLVAAPVVDGFGGSGMGVRLAFAGSLTVVENIELALWRCA